MNHDERNPDPSPALRMTLSTWLEQLAEAADAAFAAENERRDQALTKSRALIRLCSTAIRAGHRDAWDEAHTSLAEADEIGQVLQEMLAPYPNLYHAGYTQDALKELAEAHITLALVADVLPPSPETLKVPYSAYLNGLCEAASELRRRCLDVMRRGEMDEAERLLKSMDIVYDVLMSFSYPDAVTGGLRRRVDQLRGVLERTRGDLTNSLQMQRLLRALKLSKEKKDIHE